MEHFFDTREEASIAAAEKIEEALQHRLQAQGSASLVVSGGTTPARCFEELAHGDLDWSDITVLASDDRWVPPGHDDSNEKLIRDHLLVNGASRAELVRYYDADHTPDSRAIELDKHISYVPFPFAVSLLGMGADGHFASLFPDAENLEKGLDLESGLLYLPVATTASPHPRISLTLAALSRSDEIVLLFFGDDKRKIYDKARKGNGRYPVTKLLWQKRAPVHVFWAP